MTKRKWSDAHISEIQRLHLAEISYQEIASRFDSTVSAIKHLMSRNRDKFEPRKQEKRWTKQQILKMQKLWVDGKSYGQIAAVFGVSRSTMSGFVSRNPEIFPPKGISGKHVLKPKAINPKTIRVEDPPRAIPHPEGATGTPWVDLGADQCQWHLNDGMDHFHDPPSNEFPCCGLPVVPGKRFCEYHVKAARK